MALTSTARMPVRIGDQPIGAGGEERGCGAPAPFGLLRNGQIVLRRLVGWQDMAVVTRRIEAA